MFNFDLMEIIVTVLLVIAVTMCGVGVVLNHMQGSSDHVYARRAAAHDLDAMRMRDMEDDDMEFIMGLPCVHGDPVRAAAMAKVMATMQAQQDALHMDTYL